MDKLYTRRISHWITCSVMLILIGGPLCVRPLAFDSIASLKALVQNEAVIVEKVEEYLIKEEERLQRVREQLDKISPRSAPRHTLDDNGWDDYITDLVEHPLNALSLIKDWADLSTMATQGSTEHFTAVTSLSHELGVTLPDQTDYKGALAAILRLQKTYNIPTEDLAAGKIYNVTSRYNMDRADHLQMGRLFMDVEHGAAISWYETYVNEDGHGPEGLTEAYTNIKQIYKQAGDYERAYVAAHKVYSKDIHNQALLDEMNEFRRHIEVQQKSGTLIQQKFFWKNAKHRGLEYYESLCRGENLRNSIFVNKELVCVYQKGVLPYVQYKEEIHSFNPRISLFIDVISDKQALLLKEKASPGLYRAQVGDPTKSITSDERIGKLSWLWDTDSEVKELSRKVSDMTGMSTQYRDIFSDSEAFQIVNYGMGGQYEPHYDFYEDDCMLDKLPTFIHGTGDRISTFMFYLSDVTAGGATVFPNIGVRVPPIKNAAAYWYNFDLAGEFGDRNTLHAGCPVLLGQKWIGNKWIRQHGQTFRRRCALDKNATDPIFYS